jgi:Uma2 family endonuclease
MSQGYEEILRGEAVQRLAPDERHETICGRLHREVGASIAGLTSTRLLEMRSVVRIESGTLIRPDLALVTAATGKIWLAAEVVSSRDHRIDTVVKKEMYEELNLPRLWMIDPRYDNVEVYHASQLGLVLKGILAARESLTESLLPGFQIGIDQLFQ